MRRAERAGVVERGRAAVRGVWAVVGEGRRGARRPVMCGRIVVVVVVVAPVYRPSWVWVWLSVRLAGV